MGSGSTRRCTPNFDGLIFISGFAWIHADSDGAITFEISIAGKQIMKVREEAKPHASETENIAGFNFTLPAIKGQEIVLTGKSGTTYKEFHATKIQFAN